MDTDNLHKILPAEVHDLLQGLSMVQQTHARLSKLNTLVDMFVPVSQGTKHVLF